MAVPTYDSSSATSILEFAKQLTGRSLSQVVQLPEGIENSRNRGSLGSLVEKHFFKLATAAGMESSGPDFPSAGVELKVTGVKRKKDYSYQAKERLVLTMINFDKIVDEEFETSTLMKKCRLILLMFYLFDKSVPAHERTFVLDPLLYSFPPEDLAQIRRDWEFIRDKVRGGLAHELSEGDTFYLGACRKGPGGTSEKLRSQPNSSVGAKARAFSLHQGFVTSIVSRQDQGQSVKLAHSTESLESQIARKFEPYIGMSFDQIAALSGFESGNPSAKGILASLSNFIITGTTSRPEQLQKAGIEMKTIRRKDSGRPAEAMSFPAFSYMEMVNEEWEDSVFCERLEKRFLFVIFHQPKSGLPRFEKVAFWNMPFADREEARQFWEAARKQISIDASALNLESRIAHIRPKGRNGSDKIPTPQGTMLVRKCFWLNQSYLQDVLESL